MLGQTRATHMLLKLFVVGITIVIPLGMSGVVVLAPIVPRYLAPDVVVRHLDLHLSKDRHRSSRLIKT